MSTQLDPSNDLMSPGASPNNMGGGGVRRVNNLPMIIFIVLVALFLLVVGVVLSNRGKTDTQQNSNKKEVRSVASQLVNGQTDGIIKKPQKVEPPPPPPPPPEKIIIAKPERLDMPPSPPAVKDEDALRLRAMRAQMFEQAVKAKTPVSAIAPSSSNKNKVDGAKANQNETKTSRNEASQMFEAMNPFAAFQKQLAMGSDGNDKSSQKINVDADGGNSISTFINKSGQDRWRLDSAPEAPRTPYELRAGFVIPATLISGINSDLPGQIIGQVSQNVYDTPTGKYLLIPQGSRLVGAYSSDIIYGQSRILIAWQRIVFPDGKAMDIGAMPGADSAGYAGFQDQVNNHYFRIFGSAILMSLVVSGMSYSTADNNATSSTSDYNNSINDSLRQSLAQQLGQVTAALIMKNLNIAPTLEIRPGYRFNIMVTKDMTFSKPYKSFDY